MANKFSSSILEVIEENGESSEDWSSEIDHKIPSHAQQKNNMALFEKNSSLAKCTGKSKKKVISICLTHCRYELIRKTARKFAFKEVSEGENWNIYWTDLSITVDRCKEMKRFQKINHFPGMLEICRKDLLARNLNRMLRLFPNEYNFFPKTWCFPADLGEALTYSRLRKHKTFILKPDAGSQGRGIIITKTLRDVRPSDRGICQVYITRPYLIDGYKFDLRVYTLITSCEPLRIYIYNEGLVRFATSRYKEPNIVNISNVFMHLTNYAVNKHSRTYNQDTEGGSKRKISWLNNFLRELNHDVDSLWYRIDDVIIKTIISAWPILKHSYAACFPNHDVIPACCELLGIDIILDKRLNPQILEVNHSPSFHTDTALDTEVKEALLTDMFSMLNLDNCDKRKVLREDKKRVRDRLLHGLSKDTPSVNDAKSFTEYYRQELSNKGDFRLVYPTAGAETSYSKYFDQTLGSLYCDTAASRAREAAQNALRDEMHLKAKLEAAKRIIPLRGVKQQDAKPLKNVSSKVNSGYLMNSNNSFEPQMIVEADERQRLQRLAQREYLIRSSGIIEHAYFVMKKLGTLRPHDEKKFGIFDKIRNAAKVINSPKPTGPAICDLMEGVNANNIQTIIQPTKVLYPWTATYKNNKVNQIKEIEPDDGIEEYPKIRTSVAEPPTVNLITL